MATENHRKCLIFSAPSGAGKTTIVHFLLGKISDLSFSISACSRDPRINEKDGVDYHFLGIKGFKQKIKENAFLEWEEVYDDNFYGTLRSEIERIWSLGKTVIFDVDVVGGLALKNIFGENALAVFVKPPSYEELENRLRYRSTESEDKIKMRMEKAHRELAMAETFDYVLVNDDLEFACEEALTVTLKFIKKK